MAVNVVISRSIRETNLADWSRVCDPAADLLMSPQLLEAAEVSMGVGTAGGKATDCETRFWYVLAYRDEEPVGAACVTEFPLDTMVLAGPISQKFVAGVRCLWPSYLKFRVTFCGLPISTAGSNIRVAPGADAGATIRALNAAVEQISRERKTLLVIYKELDDREAALLEPLKSDDFVRGDSLPMNVIANSHGGFDGMLRSMRSHYRYKIGRSRNKFAKSGLTLTRISDPAEIEHIYTPEIHAMYDRVTRQAEHRLEILPREFFLELVARFPMQVLLTTVSQHDRVLAFAWSLLHGRVYRNLFVGIDYDNEDDNDAYFNLMVEDIRHGMGTGADEIQVGQTADDFKSRLGCESERRHIFVKATNRLLRWAFRLWETSLLTPIPPAPERNVFKEDAPGAADRPAIAPVNLEVGGGAQPTATGI